MQITIGVVIFATLHFCKSNTSSGSKLFVVHQTQKMCQNTKQRPVSMLRACRTCGQEKQHGCDLPVEFEAIMFTRACGELVFLFSLVYLPSAIAAKL